MNDLKEQVDELVNYLRSEDEGFIQDSQDNGLLDAHIGFFVSYKKVIEACGCSGTYGSDPLELITDMRNLIDQQAEEIDTLTKQVESQREEIEKLMQGIRDMKAWAIEAKELLKDLP